MFLVSTDLVLKGLQGPFMTMQILQMSLQGPVVVWWLQNLTQEPLCPVSVQVGGKNGICPFSMVKLQKMTMSRVNRDVKVCIR